MSGNFAIRGGRGFGRLMANAILNFHFDFLHTSLIQNFLFNKYSSFSLFSGNSREDNESVYSAPLANCSFYWPGSDLVM